MTPRINHAYEPREKRYPTGEMMGYPMNYSRVVGRNQLSGDYAGSFNHEDRREQSLSLIRGDMRRLESDQRDERHLAAYATRAGITVAQAKQVLDDFFGAQDVIHERALVMQSEIASPSHGSAAVTPDPLRTVSHGAGITDNDKRWRFLEHGCQWVSWTPIGGETHSWDPRDVKHLQAMRESADKTLHEQVALLRAEAAALELRMKK